MIKRCFIVAMTLLIALQSVASIAYETQPHNRTTPQCHIMMRIHTNQRILKAKIRQPSRLPTAPVIQRTIAITAIAAFTWCCWEPSQTFPA